MTKKEKIHASWRQLLTWYLVFVLLCCTVPATLHRKAEPVTAETYTAISSSGERARCIDDNVEALSWRLRLLREAEEEIILSTLDFRADESGQDMMAALLEAAERGVHVRILVDGIDGQRHLGGSDAFAALNALPNVETRLYNVVKLYKPWTVNYRLHDKYLIVDDHAFLLGGRNTHDLFLGDYSDKGKTDREILVYNADGGDGDTLAALRRYFTEVWELDCCAAPVYRKSDETLAAATAALHVRYDALNESWPAAFAPIDWENETISVAGTTLLANPSTAGSKAPTLWKALCAAMSEGSDIAIQTPYIMYGDSMYADMTALCAGEGRVIRVYTNSPETGVNAFGIADYLYSQRRIHRTGVEVYEYLGSPSLHTKTVLIDDHISIVGSFNMDMRSAFLDTELMLVVDSPELNAALREELDAIAAQSRRINADGVKEYGEQAAATVMSLPRCVLYAVLGILTRPIRYLL